MVVPIKSQDPATASPSPEIETGTFARQSAATCTTITTVNQSHGYQFNDSSANRLLEILQHGLDAKNIQSVCNCVEQLDYLLDKTNALKIYTTLTKVHKKDLQPSAPPLKPQSQDCQIEQKINDLVHNCLLEIDKEADYILQQPEIVEVSYEDLLSITTRNSLRITNERFVYNSIIKWAKYQCLKRELATSATNLRFILKDLVYAPRYGLMTKKEFKSDRYDSIHPPVRSGILDEEDWRAVMFFIKEKSKSRPVKPLPYKGSLPRVAVNDKPVVLSSKSLSRWSEVSSTGKFTGRRNVSQRRISWLRNLRFGLSSVELFRIAVSKIRIAMMISNLKEDAEINQTKKEQFFLLSFHKDYSSYVWITSRSNFLECKKFPLIRD